LLLSGFKVDFPNIETEAHWGRKIGFIGSMEAMNTFHWEPKHSWCKHKSTNGKQDCQVLVRAAATRTGMALGEVNHPPDLTKKKRIVELQPCKSTGFRE
jgi:hypothetical protein